MEKINEKYRIISWGDDGFIKISTIDETLSDATALNTVSLNHNHSSQIITEVILFKQEDKFFLNCFSE